jgi:hypothetical protein
MEVVADDEPRSAELASQDVGHEAFGGGRRQRRIEPPDEDDIDAEGAGDLLLGGFGRKAEEQGAGLEESPGMWVEGEHPALSAAPSRFIMRNIDQAAMAVMHAVEVADRHDGAAQFSRRGIVGSIDGEAWRDGAGPSHEGHEGRHPGRKRSGTLSNGRSPVKRRAMCLRPETCA